MAYVENERWGGLPLTLLLATFGIAFAFPLSILLALGRRSTLPVDPLARASAYIELIRGVPLISAAVHGLGDVPAVPAGGHDHRQAAARADRDDPVRRAPTSPRSCAAACRRSRAGSTRRPTRSACRTGRMTGLIILPQALRIVDPAAGEHLHRLFQGHLAGADHRPVRPADHGQGGARRARRGRASASRPICSPRRCTSSSASRCRATARRSRRASALRQGRTVNAAGKPGRPMIELSRRQQVVRRRFTC